MRKRSGSKTIPGSSSPGPLKSGAERQVRQGTEGGAGRPGGRSRARPAATTGENRVRSTDHPRLVNMTPPVDPVKTCDSEPIWRYPGGNSKLQ
jgi:hypothetical protein